MASKTIRKKTAGKTATTHEAPAPATAADVELSATLIPSTRKERGWTADGKLVETFANMLMQEKLRGIEKELAVLEIDIEKPLALASEGEILRGALERLDQSAGRIQQRLVEINKRLLNFQTRLLRVKSTAAPNGKITTALQGLAGLRAKQTKQIKATRTKAKRKRTAIKKPATAS